MADLMIAMNGYPIGTLHRSPSGAHEFWYNESWLKTPGARPISLSLPLGRRRFKGEVVYNFFDNLLPDNMQIRQRIVAPEQDRATFMRAQVVFWLLAATDGHAKNFSLHLLPDSAFRLTPLYDILSVYPVMGGAGLSERKVKMAMGLHGTKGRQYKWNSIFPRHFLTTAKAAGFDENAMQAILDEVRNKVPAAVATVRASLPADFPVEISEAIFEGMLKRAKRMGETS